jgi:CBS domain-containing protein
MKVMKYRGIRVRDAMSSPVLVVKADATVQEVAATMRRTNVGNLIVIDKKGKPVGIVTESDVTSKVVAKGLRAGDVKVQDVMTSPIISVNVNTSLETAADIMRRSNVQHLAVMERGRLVGLLSTTNVALITKDVLSILSEREKIYGGRVTREPSGLAGYCERCNAWSIVLKNVDGRFICEDCRVELRVETIE